jgi:uncharacterized RDD family membrane protein YckC
LKNTDSETTYLLVVNGKPQGPYRVEELKNFNIKPADFVRSDDMDDYKEAHEVAQLRELLGFSRPHHIPQYYGSFDQRLLASFLDWFIISGTLVVFVASFLLFIPDKALRMSIALSLLAVIPLTKLIYHIVMESSAKQATYGKRLLKIKVCDMQGEPLGLAKSTGRNLAKIFSVLPLFIGYMFSFFNSKQQCLHDMIAGTLVIRDRLI